MVQALEGDEEDLYTAQSSPEVDAIAADEREHAAIWDRLNDGKGSARHGKVALAATDIAAGERWHRVGRSGTLRAVIFGVSDGLVSNLALVMGIAGASQGQGSFVLLAGIAGLLAGAFSMAAGEYISMQSQRELFERQIALEKAELEAMPEEEQAELAQVYRAKGFTEGRGRGDRGADVRRPGARPRHPGPRGAGPGPGRAGLAVGRGDAARSWRSGLGALVPVIPYLLTSGSTAFLAAIALSLGALFAVGAGVSLLTGRGLLFSGARQVLIGAAAAAVTYLVGHAIGVAV